MDRASRIKRNGSSASDFSGNSNYDISMSKIETTVLTPNGDVLVCRDRHSNFTNDDGDYGVCPSNVKSISRRQFCIDPTLFNPCEVNESPNMYCDNYQRMGLLGGASDDIEVVITDDNIYHDNITQLASPKATPPKVASLNDYYTPGSFDYSDYETSSLVPREKGGFLAEVPENQPLRHSLNSPNSASISMLFSSLMLGPEPEDDSDTDSPQVTPDSLEPPNVMHGVPTCLPGLSEIKIRNISAHPLGSHVLLVSSEALLFSYGLNDMGQLGLGTHEKFIKTPTLVTAVLEAGGKTLTCAAGVDNSLVVVRTEGQRVRSLRDKQLEYEHETIGMQKTISTLGREVSIKLTRVVSSPSHLDTGRLGRSRQQTDVENGGTVLYHHQVYGFGSNRHKKLGLINPPSDESAHLTLPHRVSLSANVWPDEINSTTTLPPAGVFQVATSQNHSAALVRRGTGDIELYTWGETRQNALGISDTGNVIPLPTKVETLSYNPSPEFEDDSVTFLKDDEYPSKVALGQNCTFVITSLGRCISVGTDKDGVLGVGRVSTVDPIELKFSRDDKISSISVGSQHAFATAPSGNVYMWGRDPVSDRSIMLPERLKLPPIAKACAGYDASAYVNKSGLVQTCGLNSGRLGQGEVPPNSIEPAPLFGGLRLWHEGNQKVVEREIDTLEEYIFSA